MTSSSLPVCPRCRSTTTKVRSMSPVPGVWTVYGCDTCFYTWRSTEPSENTNPDKYPEVFRLEPDDIVKLPEVPAIPPLRRKTGQICCAIDWRAGGKESAFRYASRRPKEFRNRHTGRFGSLQWPITSLSRD